METDLIVRFTIVIGVSGGCAALRFKVPAGALIGSMLAVAVMNVALGTAYMPTTWKFYTQVSTGAYLGAKLSRADLRDMKRIVKPAVLLAAVMLAFTTVVGILICQISDLTPAASMFGVAPAGIADMALIAEDMGADSIKIAGMHTLRLIGVVALYPAIIGFLVRLLS